jgi:hypothetical protein
MKSFVCLPLFVFLLLMQSCRTLSYFESPNNLRNMEGTLYLQNGKSYSGKLIIETENAFSRPVRLYVAGERKPMQFKLADVKAYQMRDQLYELKEIREALSIGPRRYFMRRLTLASSRIHLFEFLKKEGHQKTMVRHEPEYYVQLPKDEGNLVYAAGGSAFVPHFEEKMSRLVQDCPPLAKKIAEKHPGYFYAQVSLLREKRADVLMRIIEEYNACGGDVRR